MFANRVYFSYSPHFLPCFTLLPSFVLLYYLFRSLSPLLISKQTYSAWLSSRNCWIWIVAILHAARSRSRQVATLWRARSSVIDNARHSLRQRTEKRWNLRNSPRMNLLRYDDNEVVFQRSKFNFERETRAQGENMWRRNNVDRSLFTSGISEISSRLLVNSPLLPFAPRETR